MMTMTFRSRWGHHRTLALGLIALLACLVANPARAFIGNDYDIFHNLQTSPDIGSLFVDVDYVAGSGTLTAFNPPGGTTTLLLDGTSYDISDGRFDLNVLIDPATGNALSGSLLISGTIADLGYTSGTLLSGSLSGFGSGPSPGDSLKFLFSALTGDAADLFGGAAGRAGVLLSASAYPGGLPSAAFREDFSDSFTAADTAGVPEPATWLLLAGGIPLLFRSRRLQSAR